MEDNILFYVTLALVGFTALIVLAVVLQMLYLVSLLLRKESPVTATATETLWARINKRFVAGNLVPTGTAQEEDLKLDHIYDGIQELDNHMPPWLRYLFLGTIAFAAIYLVNYFALGLVQTSDAEYVAEMAQAEQLLAEHKAKAAEGIDENTVRLVTDAAAITEGQTIFSQNCGACHGAVGEGGVGPNLTDEYWLHGGSVNEVFKTIKYGVPQKGMISWQQKLKPAQLQNLASYILSLQGTNPSNGKAPQGEKVANTEVKPEGKEISMK
jgi:cytochrome c oxidase cbb3-type subunit 3